MDLDPTLVAHQMLVKTMWLLLLQLCVSRNFGTPLYLLVVPLVVPPSYLNIRWRDSVTATKITGQDCVIQLLECSDEDLWKYFTRAAGGTLTTKIGRSFGSDLDSRMQWFEELYALHEMPKDRDELIRYFGARITGQAGVCKYLPVTVAERIATVNTSCKTLCKALWPQRFNLTY